MSAPEMFVSVLALYAAIMFVRFVADYSRSRNFVRESHVVIDRVPAWRKLAPLGWVALCAVVVGLIAAALAVASMRGKI